MKISGGIFEKNNIIKKLEIILKKTSKENFWKDQKNVKNILKEKKFYEELISSYKNFNNDIKNLKDLNALGNEEKNEEIIKDCSDKIFEIQSNLKKIEIS